MNKQILLLLVAALTIVAVLSVSTLRSQKNGVAIETESLLNPYSRLNTDALSDSDFAKVADTFTNFVSAYDIDVGTQNKVERKFTNFAVSNIEIKNLQKNVANGKKLFGINRYSSYSGDEFVNLQKFAFVENPDIPTEIQPNTNLEFSASTSVRANPYPVNDITKVKNIPYFNWATNKNPEKKKLLVDQVLFQHRCGNCWAQAATGVMEGFEFLINKKQKTFSPQFLTMCTPAKKHVSVDGCAGGDALLALFWYTRGFGCMTRTEFAKADYYTLSHMGQEGFVPDNKVCPVYNKKKPDYSKCGNEDAVLVTWPQSLGYHKKADGTMTYKYSPAIGERVLQYLYTFGPGLVLVDASNWQHVMGDGIITDPKFCDPENVNHAVLLVGFDKDAATGQEYWILKNSYSNAWGDQGYIKILKDNRDICGIARRANFVTLNQWGKNVMIYTAKSAKSFVKLASARYVADSNSIPSSEDSDD